MTNKTRAIQLLCSRCRIMDHTIHLTRLTNKTMPVVVRINCTLKSSVRNTNTFTDGAVFVRNVDNRYRQQILANVDPAEKEEADRQAEREIREGEGAFSLFDPKHRSLQHKRVPLTINSTISSKSNRQTTCTIVLHRHSKQQKLTKTLRKWAQQQLTLSTHTQTLLQRSVFDIMHSRYFVIHTNTSTTQSYAWGFRVSYAYAKCYTQRVHISNFISLRCESN